MHWLAWRKDHGVTVARNIAVTTAFAGLIVGAAGTASAGAPTMDGGYTLTSTSPGGKSVDTDWTVNSCGEGCVYIKAGAGGSQAHFVDGQWVMNTIDNIQCADGSWVLYAANAHMTWDPNSLAGSNILTYIVPACGLPPGHSQSNQIQIKATPPSS
jgi:hypothetical protein